MDNLIKICENERHRVKLMELENDPKYKYMVVIQKKGVLRWRTTGLAYFDADQLENAKGLTESLFKIRESEKES